jgi:hypothetical protein
MTMKTVKIIAIGLGIWSVSLLWPQVNEWLTPESQLGLALGLGSIVLLYAIWKKHHKARSGQNHPTINHNNTGNLASLPGWSNLY